MKALCKYAVGAGVWLVLVTGSFPLAAEQGFFQQELVQDKQVRVRAEHDLPHRAWEQACRSALLEPYRLQQIEQLERQAEVKLEGYGAFVSASIEGYSSHRQDGWLYCTADTVHVDEANSLAGTALREAWQGRGIYGRETLVQLLQVALQNPDTYDDAVVLVATTTDTNNQLQFLDENLDPTQLALPVAFESVFEIWLEHANFATVIQFEQQCESVKCRQLVAQARNLKEQEDAEKVYDLSSYF